jgi:riboflavin synthase
MFTGLIEDLGAVKAVERGEEGARLRIATSLASEIAEGDSVAVNGCCLTATAVTADSFETEAMNQTRSPPSAPSTRAAASTSSWR